MPPHGTGNPVNRSSWGGVVTEYCGLQDGFGVPDLSEFVQFKTDSGWSFSERGGTVKRRSSWFRFISAASNERLPVLLTVAVTAAVRS